jgi:hypothetical protein
MFCGCHDRKTVVIGNAIRLIKDEAAMPIAKSHRRLIGRETILNTLLAKIIAGGRAIGPYAAIELLMPGGSLIAILLWIYRNNQD